MFSLCSAFSLYIVHCNNYEMKHKILCLILVKLDLPPYPVRSSTSPNFGALQTLHCCLRAQFTLLHLLHCQSSALNNPRLFSAAAFPISCPNFFFFKLTGARDLLHLLQAFLLAKFTFPQSEHFQSPSKEPLIMGGDGGERLSVSAIILKRKERHLQNFIDAM